MARKDISYAGVTTSSEIGYFPDFNRNDKNHSIAAVIKRHPSAAQKVVTDEDPLNVLILFGTVSAS